ncbi:unnamed protein product [Mytilus coruscus]|uniref:PiggyBac transposable element-derived protein domain-containing protein n=1 Tax=Mytilus coruscus TaxID=42192 RepID=A0A6J8ACT3_MYTCO|nr:unnamed protein product [Mytilus coruscus]
MNANPWFRVRPQEIDYLHDQRFVENSGPQNVLAADAKSIDYYLLFLTLDFLRHIVRKSIVKCQILIKNPVLQEKECVYIRQGSVLLCACKERYGRKPVRLVFSFSKATQENDKPAMICAYNKFMGGVDLADMMTESYNDGRKTLKVWKKDNLQLSRLLSRKSLLRASPKTTRRKETKTKTIDKIRINTESRSCPVIERNIEMYVQTGMVKGVEGGEEKFVRVCSNWVHRNCKDNHLCVES